MPLRSLERRRFLQGAGAFAASTLLAPGLINSAFASRRKHHVVIIGAGISGLAAAHRLKQHGWDVTVIEARSRIGGRVQSHRFAQNPNLVCELGAEWIGADHERVLALCKAFGLPLQSHRFTESLLQNGKLKGPGEWDYSPRSRAAWQKFARDWEKLSTLDQNNLDRYDWWTWLKRIGYTDEDLRLRDLIDSTDFGESIRTVSAYAAAAEFLESNETHEMDFKISGGNGRLPQALAARVGLNNIRLKTTVTHITQKRGKVYVRAGGEVLVADGCICTAPARVLNNIRFDPALPDEQVKAAWELQYSRIVKNQMLFDERFWKREDYALVSDTTSHYFFHATQNQKGEQGILTSYAIGEKADVLALQSAERRREIIAHDLTAINERAPQLSRGIASYAWPRDPWTQGAYAIYRPGQWLRVRPLLAKPHGKVLFAGEHLADWQGYMEGAITTGQDAADALLGK